MDNDYYIQFISIQHYKRRNNTLEFKYKGMIQHDRVHLQQRIEEQERIAKVNEALIRFLQLSLQLFFQWGFRSFSFFGFLTMTAASQSHQMHLRSHSEKSHDESDIYTKIVQPLCLVWTLYNFFILMGVKCIDQMNHFTLIATGVINYLIAVIIVFIGFIQDPHSNNASKQIYHRYTPFQVLNCIIVVSFFYFTKAPQPRRFSTSPGNFVWVWLFLTWKWKDDIQGYMYSIGVIYLIITLTSIVMLFLEIKSGLTACLKKLFISQWVFCLVLTILTEIFAVISHNIIYKIQRSSISQKLEDQLAVGLLQIFIIVNILDMAFWIIGGCMM